MINIGDAERVIGRFGATDAGKTANPNRNDDPASTALNAAPGYDPSGGAA